MLPLLSVLACKDASPPDTGGTDDTTGAILNTGETGGPDCLDGQWLAGGYWDLDAEIDIPPDNALVARDLLVDASGQPHVLVQHHTQDGALEAISVRTRSESSGPLSIVSTWSGTSLDSRAWLPDARVFGRASDDMIWIGGALSAEGTRLPFVVPLRSGIFDAPVVLDAQTAEGTVSSGPVLTEAGMFWLGTRRDGASGMMEMVLWRIDAQGVVEELFETTELSPGDTAGQMEAGALFAAPDGSVLFGGGARSSVPGGERAVLYRYDGSVTEIRSLSAAETGGLPGAITAIVAGSDGRLAFSWGAFDAPREGNSALLFVGSLSDPGAAVAVDSDQGTEDIDPLALAVYPNGTLFLGGALSRDSDELLSPMVRTEFDGSFVMNFFAPGPNAGYIRAFDVADDGDVWALCLYDNDGLAAIEITLLRMQCFL